jgi:hypothetical protein
MEEKVGSIYGSMLTGLLLTAFCRYYDAVMMRNEYAILQAKHNGA